MKGKGRAGVHDVVTHDTLYTGLAPPSGLRRLKDTTPAVDIADAVRFAGLMPPPAPAVSRSAATSPQPGMQDLIRSTSAQSGATASDTASLRGTIASTSSAIDTGPESLKQQQPAKKKKKVKTFPEQRHTRPKEPFTQVVIGSALTNANLDVRRPVLQGSMGTPPTHVAQPSSRATASRHTVTQTSQPARRREERAARWPRAVGTPRALIPAPTPRPPVQEASRAESTQMINAVESIEIPAVMRERSSAALAVCGSSPGQAAAEQQPPPWTAPQSTMTLAFTPMHAYITDMESAEADQVGDPEVPDSPTTAAFMAALGQSSPSANRMQVPEPVAIAMREPDSPPPEFRSRPPSPLEGLSTNVDQTDEHWPGLWPDLDPDAISLRSRGYASSENEADLTSSTEGMAANGVAAQNERESVHSVEATQRRRQMRMWEVLRRQGVDAETRWQRLQQGASAPEVPPSILPAAATLITTPVTLAASENDAAPTDNVPVPATQSDFPAPIPPRPIANPPVTTSTTAELVALVQEAVRIPSTSTLLQPQPAPVSAVREPSPAPSASSESEPRSSLVSEPRQSTSARFPSIGTVRRARLARFEAQRQNSKTMSSVIETSPTSSAVGLPVRRPTFGASPAGTASPAERQSARVAVSDSSHTSMAAATLAQNLPAKDRAVEGGKDVQVDMSEVREVSQPEPEASSTTRVPAHHLAKRLSAEIEARAAVKPVAPIPPAISVAFPTSAQARAKSTADSEAALSSPMRTAHADRFPPTTPKAKRKKNAGTVANRISRLIKPQTAQKQAPNDTAPKEPPEMTLPRAPPRVTTDPLSVDNLRKLSRSQDKPSQLHSAQSQSSSSGGHESGGDSESSFDNAKSDSDSDSADDESTRKPASTLLSYPVGALPLSISVNSALRDDSQKELAAASWRRTEDGRRHSALLSRPLSIKRKPPAVPAKRWGGIWDKSLRLFENLEDEMSNALNEPGRLGALPGSFLLRVREDEEPGWQTVGQPESLAAPRLPSFAWETAGHDEPVPGAVARAIAALSLNERREAPYTAGPSTSRQSIPRRLPPLPEASVSLRDADHSSQESLPLDAAHSVQLGQQDSRTTDTMHRNGEDNIGQLDQHRSTELPVQSTSNSGTLKRAGATRRPQSISYPKPNLSLPSPPTSPNDATRATLNARPRHVYSSSLPSNSLPIPSGRPRRPLPTPPADVPLPEGVVPAFDAFDVARFTNAQARDTTEAAHVTPEEQAFQAESPAPAFSPATEMDTILADIEGTGVSAVSTLV